MRGRFLLILILLWLKLFTMKPLRDLVRLGILVVDICLGSVVCDKED